MHHLSFTSQNPVFDFAGLHFSVQVFTFENVYELDRDAVSASGDETGYCVSCNRLTWAGGQEKAKGSVRILANKESGNTVFRIKAEHDTEKIRSVKLVLKSIPRGRIAGLRMPASEGELKDIPPEGFLFRYPDGFHGLYTPLLILKHEEGEFSFFRSRDDRVRPKTFVLLPNENALNVELIFEESARHFSTMLEVPAWEIGCASRYEGIMDAQAKYVLDAYHIACWEEREDVPRWARQVSLIAAVHCMHWTGYVFHTYEQVLSDLRWIAERIDPARVLAYLPGWEGRYYWQYGDFRPDPRLGGSEKFKRLIDEAHKMGMHVMPMFMINGANPRTEGFDQWGEPSIYVSPGGFKQIWGSCDWDTSRHYDHNCGLPLNPGSPLWQDRLVGQVNSLIDTYGFDAVFMDLAAVYVNDPRYDTYLATIDIARKIRDRHPDVLLSGEGWYDAMSVSMPLVQPSLTLQGETLWPDGPYAPIFDQYCRVFGHLGTGDPSRGSTGVFEFGYNRSTHRVPLRKGVIPTVTIVDGTTEKAPGRVSQIIQDAQKYADLYIE